MTRECERRQNTNLANGSRTSPHGKAYLEPVVGVTGCRGSQLPKLICLAALLAAMVCGECAPWAHGDWVPAGDAAFGGWLKLKQPSWGQWLSEGVPLKVLLGLPVIPF